MAANGDRQGVTSRARKVLIGAGAALLILVMVLGAFSLGVYVGNRGLLAGTLQDYGARRGPGQQPPQPPAGSGQWTPQSPAGPQQELPPGRPALVGRLGAITNEGLFIQTPQGPRLVQVDEDTKVQDQQGRELSLDDLQQGMQVAIFGNFSSDGRRLIAETVVIVAPLRS